MLTSQDLQDIKSIVIEVVDERFLPTNAALISLEVRVKTQETQSKKLRRDLKDIKEGVKEIRSALNTNLDIVDKLKMRPPRIAPDGSMIFRDKVAEFAWHYYNDLK